MLWTKHFFVYPNRVPFLAEERIGKAKPLGEHGVGRYIRPRVSLAKKSYPLIKKDKKI